MRSLAIRVGLLLAALALASSVASAGGDGWRHEKTEDGVKMYSRAVPDWSIREIRGTVEIDASLSSIIAVLMDTTVAHELSEVIVEDKILQREDDRHYRLYSVMDLPWPVSDRDMASQREIAQDPQTFAVTVHDVALAADSGVPLRDGVVRMVRSEQTWTLTPNPKGVAVELRVLADPNGPIPAAIINAMSVNTPLKTLIKLREMARKPAYADAKVPFIKTPAGERPADALR